MAHQEHNIDSLLDRYDNDDVRARRELAALKTSLGAQQFLIEVRSALLTRAPSKSLKYVASLVEIHDLIGILLDSYLQSKQEALTLARKFLDLNPRFDAMLLECLRDEELSNRFHEPVLIALDILDAISEGDRLVLSVSKFIRHPDPKLRSKAALFIARRRPHLHWVKDLGQEADARVRANMIESLCEVEETFVTPLLHSAVTDENNRVAGNAVLGLYRRGDTASISLIQDMAQDARPEFRNTGAWVMGRTGDPRFAPILARQLSDTDDLVRRQALRGLGEMKKALKSAREVSPLQVAILSQASEPQPRSFIATVHNESLETVRNIPPTRFFLKAGGTYIKQCTVEEITFDNPITAKFLLCLPAEPSATLSTDFDVAIQSCSRLQRPKDLLTATQVTPEEQLMCASSGSASRAEILKRALPDVEFLSPNLHLIVVGASPKLHVMEALFDLGANLRATVHVIAVSPPWHTLRHRVHKLNGFFQAVDEQVNFAQACCQIYSALLHHYRLTWEDGDGNLELEIRSSSGSGIATCEAERDLLSESPLDRQVIGLSEEKSA
ncbi:MAG: HEAT repeat domain-containing protein [Acidobacteriaceae bacterium]|nr:HEAT repeat domain-containing protein [Acidobacteriaceae bacterium]